MMNPSFNPRRGYDERYYSNGPEQQGQRFEQEPRGDWMRETHWGRGREQQGEQPSPIVKVIEILAQSPHSWEDATRRAVVEASRSIRNIRSIYIKDMQAIVDDDQVVCFRINAKISFALDDQRMHHRSERYQERR